MWLTSSTVGKLISLFVFLYCTVVGGSLAPAASRPPTVLTLAGDSIGVGTYADDSRLTLQHQLEDRTRGALLILNHSYGGDGISGNGITRHVPNALDIWATGGIPVIMLGTNDWARSTPLDQFSSEYESFLDAVTYLRDRAYCVTPLWRANENQPNAAGLFLQEYRDAIARVCATLPQAVTVDGLQLVPADPSYFVDGLHPNARGNVLMARRLAAIFSTTLPATAPASADEPFP